MILFRPMKVDADGKPKVGTRSYMLGVRPTDPNNTDPKRGSDVAASADTDIVQPGEGLSTSMKPDAKRVGKGEALFRIDTDLISDSLAVNPDRPPHCLLEVPAGGTVTLAEFQERLAATRDLWERVQPEGGS